MLIVFSLAALWLVPESWAQVTAPNAAGVSLGHAHLNVRDVEAHKKFWVALGGKPMKLGTIEGMKFPNGFVFLRQMEPTGGSVESIVNHIGFFVPDVEAALAKWKSQGLQTESATPDRGYVTAPDDLRIEINRDTSLTVPIVMRHIHFYAVESALPEIEAWYVKMFGAKPEGNPGVFDIPGVTLRVRTVDTVLAPTQGRVLDHIGFEVKNLEAFCKKLEANGVKFDRPYTERPALGIALAFITDPWGTYIELTEGLNKL
jgi:catechol 2,3-dioxygenase-like lactoylglutathione lyase family enzyme